MLMPWRRISKKQIKTQKMKKNTILFFTAISCFALTNCVSLKETQKKMHSKNSKELKINIMPYNLIFQTEYSFYSAEFEYILKGGKKSLGLALGSSLKLGNNSNETNSFKPFPDFLFLPYYRHYYGDQNATGFFTEAAGTIAYIGENKSNENSLKSWGAGLGFSAGYKHLTKANWSFEVFVGDGFNTNSVFHPRLGISIGKRF